MSNKHAGIVPLVLNFETGNITEQWNMVFDDWFSTVATNVDNMPEFHADEWSKMFGTGTFDTKSDDKIKESAKKPMQLVRWDIEDNTIDKKEALWHQMLRPNLLTEPNRLMTKPSKTHSQAMSEQVEHQSKSPSQEQRHTPKANHQPNTM